MKLINGDCLIEMEKFKPCSVDMVLCDLPYGKTKCSWDKQINLVLLWDSYSRIIKKNGVIALTAQQPFSSDLIISGRRFFRYSMVWEKSKATGFLNAKKRPLVAHEDVLIFSVGTPCYFPQMGGGKAYNKGNRKQQTENDIYSKFNSVKVKSDGGRYPRSVVYFKTAESEGAVFHKTQKPIALMEYLIKTYTKEGQTVLDNCMGSGTTGVACNNLKREFIGIEKDETYFNIAKERIDHAIQADKDKGEK